MSDGRPTETDLAEVRGLRCPNCHCTDLRVYYTRKRRNYLLRVRLCRHCGRRVPTYERPADPAAR